MKCPLRLVVAEARLSKVYPRNIKKYLMGLYATLHLADSAKQRNIESIIYYAFNNGYVLGAANHGAEAQKVADELPDLGVDEETGDDATR